MKIKNVDVFQVRVPLKKVSESAHGAIIDQDSIVARIRCKTGEYGLGAIEPREGYDEESVEEILDTLKGHLIPKLIGQDPFRTRKIVDEMDAAIPSHLGSKAILEMGLFDLIGKKLKVPAHVLFGGKVKDIIFLNGWVGLVKPEQARQEAQDMLTMGFSSLKVKINADVAATQKRVRALRSVVKNKVQIRVDANEALNFQQARETVEVLKPFKVLYLEQPLPRESFDDFFNLGRISPVKLMADESIHDMETLLRVLRSGAVQFVKVKIQKMGGFLKTFQAIQVAEAFGVPVILGHGFGLTINTLAELHLASCTHAVIDGCEAVGPFKMADDVVKKPIIMNKGFIRVPDGPGLGVDLDEKKLKKYCVE